MKHGFSLVELSIVLVILGLLVGGILGGQSLIRAAELRSVGAQATQYITATQAFRDKYMGLPGDLTNATKIWGAADPTPATCATTASSGVATCDGDGDGKPVYTVNSNEHFRFWQHLANAGLIEGRFDGVTHGTSTFAATTANAPAGKLGNSLWHASNFATFSARTYAFDGFYGNVLEFGQALLDYDPTNPIFKPEEMWNIDTKLDDGMPATGKLVTRGPFANCTDASASTTLTAQYKYAATTISCAAIFRNAF